MSYRYHNKGVDIRVASSKARRLHRPMLIGIRHHHHNLIGHHSKKVNRQARIRRHNIHNSPKADQPLITIQMLVTNTNRNCNLHPFYRPCLLHNIQLRMYSTIQRSRTPTDGTTGSGTITMQTINKLPLSICLNN